MRIQITDTTLRDAHQSLIATRMRTRDMLPIAEKLDAVGFFSLEVWGGATFDSCIRYLNEDPWDRLKALRAKVKNTRLQMLLRGQNLVGYRHYSDDVVREFIRLSVKNGVDVFRVFDALNDIRNMELSIQVAKSYGVHVQGTICYTTSPVHSVEGFAGMAEKLQELGSDSICIKDMAGLITPAAASDLVKAIKKRVTVPVDLHSHCSSGMAPLSYYAAALSGVDILDTAFSAFGWGSSQPTTESVVAALQGTPYDTGLDLGKLYEIGEYFAALFAKYKALFTGEATRPNLAVLLHQIPGGMISSLVSQLKEQNALDKLDDVLQEVPKVRADLGYPPLVTPTSQIVGIQAVLNVMAGQRYTKVTQEVKNYLLGYYGRAPGKVNEQVRKDVIGNERPIEVRPADLMPPELEKARNDAQKLGILRREEDLVTYALYPQVAVKFLRGEAKEEALPSGAEAPPGGRVPNVLDIPSEFNVEVDGEVFTVRITPKVDGRGSVAMGQAEKPQKAAKGSVICPMPGMILAVKVKLGDKVNEDDVVVILEAMKMQSEIRSPHSGVVKQVLVNEGDLVKGGAVLAVVEPNGR
jgi:pyruvate carboxylase subunit B